ncbi:MAG: arylesterase [Gemmatimonadetes bacterium]|nr:arylesterase [Gemmatimonadota bacterium]
MEAVLGRRGRGRTVALGALAVLLAVACGGDEKKNDTTAGKDSSSAGRPSVEKAAAAIGDKLDKGSLPVLFAGTSLTAGLGLDPDSAFPALIERKADSINLHIRAINAGLSGETSAGLARRIEWLLTGPGQIFVIESGANDGLRGIDVEDTYTNLAMVIDAIRDVRPKATIFLMQMEAPPNMGAKYAKAFHDMYKELAYDRKVWLVPFLLEGVAGKPELNQADGIHPNAKGERIVAQNVWRAIGPVIVPGLSVK